MNYNVMIYNTKNEKQKIPRCRNIYKINSKNRYNRSKIVSSNTYDRTLLRLRTGTPRRNCEFG